MKSPEPIRQSLMFEADQDRTFEAFARRLSAWWPMDHRPLHRGPTEVRIEEWGGGRIYLVDRGGREREWGQVTSWNPPDSFSFVPGVLPGSDATEVDLRFQRLGPALTRVVVEHRGWERMGGALYDRHTTYEGGWLAALRRFAAVFEADDAGRAAPREGRRFDG